MTLKRGNSIDRLITAGNFNSYFESAANPMALKSFPIFQTRMKERDLVPCHLIKILCT
jgi:hypothetical protein